MEKGRDVSITVTASKNLHVVGLRSKSLDPSHVLAALQSGDFDDILDEETLSYDSVDEVTETDAD